MSKIMNGDNLTLGTCYYPEHWPKTMWREDLERMKKTGIEVIRIAEFAWSKIEPEEGVFTYEFFDEFLDLADEVGMKVIFCTPTATPPAWRKPPAWPPSCPAPTSSTSTWAVPWARWSPTVTAPP